jgi:hypothetical protein
MSGDLIIAVAVLGPPAVFGLAVAIEEWTYILHRRARQADLARRRHPSRPPIGPEDMPDWGRR